MPDGLAPAPGANFGPQGPEEQAIAQQAPPEAPGGGNPVIAALKILGQFAVAQKEQGNPAIAEWLAQGLQILNQAGAGAEQPAAAPPPEAAAPPAGPAPVGPQQAQPAGATPVV